MTRGKGNGSLVLRGDIWNLVLSGKDGKREWFRLGKCKNQAEAEVKAEMFLDELRKGESLDNAKVKVLGVPLKNAWGIFKGKADCGAVTLKGYEIKWKNFLNFLKLTHPELSGTDQLNQGIGQHYLEWLGEKAFGPDTARRHLRWAGYILRVVAGEDPFKNIPSPKTTEKSLRNGFSSEELEAIRKVFENEQIQCLYKPEMEAAHYIALNTGLRLEDTCLLAWASVDWTRMVVTATPEKTKRYRTTVSIPITPELESVLRRAEGWKQDTFVLPSMAKRYKGNPSGISQDYTWILEKAGVVTTQKRKWRLAQILKSFHSLRHTFVSRLAERGVSPLVIQSMSGHSTMLMTERYSHIGLEAKRKALAGSTAPSTEAAAQESSVKPSIQETSAQQKLEALKVLLKGKVPDEVLALL